jgi:hypothetical protein
MNITTIETGFILKDTVYNWTDELHTEIICDSQLYAFTKEGTILLDISCTINNIAYTNINEFDQAL